MTAEELKEWRQKLKKAHLCRDCKGQDAYTLVGRTYCFDCAEKQRKTKEEARKDPEKKAKMLRQKREQVERYKSENKCVRCGKQLSDGKRMCSICYAEQRKAQKKSKGYLPRTEGICWQCNKEPYYEGHRLCKSCYEKKVSVAIKNLENSRINHPWRMLTYGKANQK